MTDAPQLMRCPFCPRVNEVSDEDPDATFGDMLSHIRWSHPEQDQAPAVLWPKIEIGGGVR